MSLAFTVNVCVLLGVAPAALFSFTSSTADFDAAVNAGCSFASTALTMMTFVNVRPPVIEGDGELHVRLSRVSQ